MPFEQRSLLDVQWLNLDLADGISFSNHPGRYFEGRWVSGTAYVFEARSRLQGPAA
jgi:hypothetical protein